MSEPSRSKSTTVHATVHPATGATLTLSTTVIAYDEGNDAQPVKRRITPDATGYYESDQPPDGSNSIRLLQLKQAGRMINGKFFQPPGFVECEHTFPIGIAAIVVKLDERSGKGFLFVYKEGTTDPTDVVSPADPYDRASVPDDRLDGSIEIAGSAPNLHVTLTFHRTQGPPAVLSFAQVNTIPVASSATIDAQSGPVRIWLEATHRTFVPSSFLDTSKRSGRRWARVMSLFTPTGLLAAPIKRYVRATRAVPVDHGRDRATVPIVRMWDDATDALRSHAWIDPTNLLVAIEEIEAILTRTRAWEGYPHAQQFDAMLAQMASRYQLLIDGQLRSIAEWLGFIAFHEQTLRPKAKIPTSFARFLGGAIVYRYTFRFSSLPLNIPIVPLALTGAVALFGAAVSASVGRRKGDGTVGDWKPVMGVVDFYGHFGELKAGLNNPPNLPSTITMDSPFELQPADFAGAVFDMYSCQAGVVVGLLMDDAAVVAGAMGYAGGSAQILRIFTRKTVLEGIFESATIAPTFFAPNLKSTTAAAAFQGRSEGPTAVALYKPKDALNLGASLGRGTFVHVGANRVRWIQPPPPVADSQISAAGRSRTVVAFEHDKYDLTRNVHGWHIRDLLEIQLADILSLLRKCVRLRVVGSASPEGTPLHNKWLSGSRAKAVLRAIQDAVGEISPEVVEALGVGDDVAIKVGGLMDPDPGPTRRDPKSMARFKEANREQVSRWAVHRVVGIEVDGVVVINVRTVTPQESQP